jgi:hypothetical protein
MIPSSPESVSHGEAQEAAKKSASAFGRVQHEIARDRTSFFEKLGLLNGGALILSISTLTYLSGKGNGLQLKPVLWATWFSFVLALIACTFRNAFYQRYFYDQHFSWYARDIAALKKAEASVVTKQA